MIEAFTKSNLLLNCFVKICSPHVLMRVSQIWVVNVISCDQTRSWCQDIIVSHVTRVWWCHNASVIHHKCISGWSNLVTLSTSSSYLYIISDLDTWPLKCSLHFTPRLCSHTFQSQHYIHLTRCLLRLVDLPGKALRNWKWCRGSIIFSKS